jgi:hypothetical protein
MACLGGDVIVRWDWDNGSRQRQRTEIEQSDRKGITESNFGSLYDDLGLERMDVD